MIALVPVSRYRVRYELASGRPYSAIERMVLEAIGDGETSLEGLETTFAIHRRPLIECVVTLMQAGWVAVKSGTGGLVLTQSGARAIDNSRELPRSIVVTPEIDHVLCERVEGQLAQGNELLFVPRSSLRRYKDRVAVVPPRDIPHAIDPGQIVPFLRKRDGEWIRSCGPVEIVRDSADYVLVDVDTRSGNITGIPTRWIALLQDEVVERARNKERALAGTHDAGAERELRKLMKTSPQEELRDAGACWAAEPDLDRILVTSNEHRSYIVGALEAAQSYVLIVADRVDAAAIGDLEPSLLAAARRGVSIDIVWGTSASDAGLLENGGARMNANLRRLAQATSESLGRISISREPARGAGNCLFFDADQYEAIVGSCSWLSIVPSDGQRYVSFIVREPTPLAHICRIAADLAALDEALTAGGGPVRLRHAASFLEQLDAEAVQRRREARERDEAALLLDVPTAPYDPPDEKNADADSDSGTARFQILAGRQHIGALAAVVRDASVRIVLMSAAWNGGAPLIHKAMTDALVGDRRVDVVTQSASRHDDSDESMLSLEKLGASLSRVRDLKAEVLVVDDDKVIIGSFRWLDDASLGTWQQHSEFGVLVMGSRIGALILERIRLSPGHSSSSIIPHYLTTFRIKNIKTITAIEWAIDCGAGAGWHVLVGDNGAGKTSILRALALALVGATSAAPLQGMLARWIRATAEMASVELMITGATAHQPLSTSEDRLALDWDRDGNVVSHQNATVDADIFSAGYGPFRRFSGGDADYEKAIAPFPGLSRHLSLFDERAALGESIRWLQELRFKELEGDAEASYLLAHIIRFVNESGLMPHSVRLDQVTSDAILFSSEVAGEYSVDDLSDGYRSILSITFDIIRQLALAYGAARIFDKEHPHIITLPGIILIDEVDAHLHPSWQRTIGQWFRSRFPRMQFIVTTHSPLVCQAAEVGSVFRLPNPNHDDDIGGMIDGVELGRLVFGNILEAYSSGAFGDEVGRSESAATLLDRLAELNQKDMIAELSAQERNQQEQLRALFPSRAHGV